MSKKNTRRGARTLAFQVLYSLSFMEHTRHEDVVRAFHQVPQARQKHADAETQNKGHIPDKEAIKNAKKSAEHDVTHEQAHIYDGMTLPTGFAWELVDGVWRQQKTLDSILTQHSRNWRVDRMGRIEHTILRMGVYEMLYRLDVPIRVAMNESLELSRLFGEESARPFINGILDTIGKLIDNGELKRIEIGTV